jgi:serine O-acetyltransferase
VLASYLQSQVSQIFQIDIHPNATLGSGIMLDHGTGIVIGETSTVGHNCSILHHVTLGGSGKKGVIRHPQVGDGVLLGAGATLLGPVTVGEGTQIGAGTLVIADLPAHCVAVGVPARIIGSFVDVTQQPSIGMNQMLDDDDMVTFKMAGI